MKKFLLSKFKFIALALFTFFISSAFISGDKNNNSKSTAGGELTFTVRTVPNGANYSPKHVFVIWIEDENGFVKTRKLRGNQRKEYLYTWKASSNYNVVDAITGPTLTSHTTHTVSWNCTGLDGEIVPDGEYTVFTEYTSAHVQGPLTSTTFTKGPDAVSITIPDETYFKDMELTFTPYVSDFIADATSICQWGTVTYTDQSVNATSWEWDFGDGAAPATSSTQGPHTVYYTTPGEKTVSLTINENITETKTGLITVGLKPEAGFDYSGSLFEVSFTNSSTGASSYLWDFGDGETSNEIDPIHTYVSSGNYTVSLTAIENDCEHFVTQNIELPLTSIGEQSSDLALSIFPNPGNGTFTIQTHDTQLVSEIEIINMEGRIIQKETFDRGINLPSFRINNEENGVYFVKVVYGKKIAVKKLIVL